MELQENYPTGYRFGSRDPLGSKSYIQQRKATCLLSIGKSLACARTSKLTTTNIYIAKARCEYQNGSGVVWAECSLIIGMGCGVRVFSLILDSSVGLSVGIQSADDSVPETLWVRILHSAEEGNLSPFDSKIAPCARASHQATCMYICMHVCMYVCMHACRYVRIYVCMYECMPSVSAYQVRLWSTDHGFTERGSIHIDSLVATKNFVLYMYKSGYFSIYLYCQK